MSTLYCAWKKRLEEVEEERCDFMEVNSLTEKAQDKHRLLNSDDERFEDGRNGSSTVTFPGNFPGYNLMLFNQQLFHSNLEKSREILTQISRNSLKSRENHAGKGIRSDDECYDTSSSENDCYEVDSSAQKSEDKHKLLNSEDSRFDDDLMVADNEMFDDLPIDDLLQLDASDCTDLFQHPEDKMRSKYNSRKGEEKKAGSTIDIGSSGNEIWGKDHDGMKILTFDKSKPLEGYRDEFYIGLLIMKLILDQKKNEEKITFAVDIENFRNTWDNLYVNVMKNFENPNDYKNKYGHNLPFVDIALQIFKHKNFEKITEKIEFIN